MNNMNKGDLIDAIAASTGLSKADAGRAVDATHGIGINKAGR